MKAFVCVALLLIPEPASAQHPSIALMDPVEEAALARTAAPEDVSADAAVWVLGARGFTPHAPGTNGWTCLVERDHPESLAPQCYDPEGTRTLVPGVVRLEALRAGGMTYLEAVARVEREYADGVLERPSRPVLSYMLSRHQRLHSSPEGPPVGAWKPHIMIYHPDLSNEALGLPEGGLASVSSLGAVFTYLVVPVADWSDGRPAGGRQGG